MRNKKIIISTVSALIVGLFAGSYIFPTHNGADVTNGNSSEKEILYWVAPMDPSFRSDASGKSPMGMDLIPVYANEAQNGDEAVVRISPEVIQNIGVVTSTVESGMLARNLETVGFVSVDEDLTSHIHVRSPGWIEDLLIKAAGEEVKKGDLLFRFYSPDITNAKSELLQAIRIGNASLIAASKSRLRAFAVPLSQIDKIIETGVASELVEVYAPQDGVVTELNVAEGMYIQSGITVLSLADLTSVWVNAEVFEDDAPWLKEGASATVHVPFLPERDWLGTVNYVYPIIDPITRTIRARLVLDNSDMTLKPNMYANVEIEAEMLDHAIKIPKQALIRTGSSNQVIEALGQGRFRPVLVTVGIESGNYVQITSGLSAGMEVVTSGQFLIDSEASLISALSRMQSPNEMDQSNGNDNSQDGDE